MNTNKKTKEQIKENENAKIYRKEIVKILNKIDNAEYLTKIYYFIKAFSED